MAAARPNSDKQTEIQEVKKYGVRANSDYYIEKKQLRHARKTSSSNFSQEALYQMMKAVINSDE